jgi:hypothetical protein
MSRTQGYLVEESVLHAPARTQNRQVATLGRAGSLWRANVATFAWGAGVLCVVFVLNSLFSRYLFWDSYLDLAAGRHIAEHGVPRAEVLTLAAQGRDWIDQQWLAHLTYYQAWRLGGYGGVAALSNLLIAAAFGLLAMLMIHRNVVPHRAGYWSLLAFFACLGNTVIRAQSFSYLLLVVVLWAIVRDYADERQGRATWLLLPIFTLWANLHGAVLLGVAIFVAYAGSQAARQAIRGSRGSALRYAVVGALVALTPLATPYGPAIIGYYKSLIGNPVVGRFILEWSAPSFANVTSFGFIALLLLAVGVIGYGIGRGYRAPVPLLAITAATGVFAAQGVRYQAWFAIAAALTIADTIAHVRPVPIGFSPRVLRVAGFASAVVAVGALALLWRSSDATYERLVPRGAMDAVGQYTAVHPRAVVLADDVTSSALLWRYPGTSGRVGYDARLESYSHQELTAWFQYIGVMTPDWLAAADGYDVLVASRSSHPELVGRLERAPGWRTLYADEEGIALVAAGP